MSSPSNQTEIHMLNVGHGDCSIIKHSSGRITMIDINNGQKYDTTTEAELAVQGILRGSQAHTLAFLGAASQSPTLLFQPPPVAAELTCPIDYFQRNFKGEPIYRFILTHPDMDHIRGLSTLLDSGVKIVNFWDTHHEIEKDSFKSEADNADWYAYQKLRSGTAGTKVFRPFRGDSNKYWNMDDEGGRGDGLTILAPTLELRDAAIQAEDPNAHSFVIHLNADGTSVIFGGDATQNVMQDVFNTYGANLKCHIYNAAHHGRDSGYLAAAVSAMAPEYTLVSVGKKPKTDASNKYYNLARGWGGKVWSTRFKGDFLIKIQGAGLYTINGELSPATIKARAAMIRSLLTPAPKFPF